RRDRHTIAHADLVLYVRAEYLLQEHQRTISLLLHERQWSPARVIRQRREGERPLAVGPVVEPAPAEVRDLDTSAQQVLAVDERQRIREVEMILRRALIRLRAAAGEG